MTTLKSNPLREVNCPILSPTESSPEFLLFSKKELKQMLDYAETYNDNVVLCWSHNPIGTDYGIISQNLWTSQEDKRNLGMLDITDSSNS